MSDHSTKKQIKSKKTLIVSAVFMAVSLALVAGFVFAWFSVTDKPQMDGSVVKIAKFDDNGYQFLQLGGTTLPDNFIIYPGDSFVFQIEATRDNTQFGININNIRLAKNDFFDRFLPRDDLVSGIYQQEMPVTINSYGDQRIDYHEFDIDKYLDDYIAANSHLSIDKQQEKAKFLWEFEQKNSIFSAVDLQIISWNGEDVAGMNFVATSVDEDNNVYFLEEATYIPKGTLFEIQVSYGNNGFYPDVQYNFLGSGDGTYRSLNYNCFIAQQLFISFLNE